MTRHNVSIVFIQLFKDAAQQFTFQLDDILRAIDEPHLEIQRVVLSQMPPRGMRLRAIHMSRLEHALESGDAMLFIELRALCKVRHAIKVFDLEKIRSALGSSRNNLGRRFL
jgi:hypothetical protein